MNKKIKVIDLLNMMANKQKMPQRIEYFDKVYEYNNGLYADYVHTNKNYENDYLISDHNTNILNDEVEILENEEEIKEIKVDENGYIQTDKMTVLKGRQLDLTFVNKINEISRKINELDKRINKDD